MNYEVLPIERIRAWCLSLVKRGDSTVSDRPTMDAISRHTGIPRNTLKWLAFKDTSSLGRERQMLLSKVIAQIENGQLVFVTKKMNKKQGPGVKIGVLVDKPKPVMRYQPKIGPNGVRLVMADRPKPFVGMRSFKDVLLG